LNQENSAQSKIPDLSNGNIKLERSTPVPGKYLYQTTERTGYNDDKKYFSSVAKNDVKNDAKTDVSDRDDKHYDDSIADEHDYQEDDDKLSNADDRIDTDVTDATYADNDNDENHVDNNSTTKPEYDYVYYYYYDYIDSEDVSSQKKSPKYFELLPSPSFLVDDGGTTLEDELTTVLPTALPKVETTSE
jgi:hypothetical protein